MKRAAARVVVAAGYAFAAWVLAALLIYAGAAWVPRRLTTAARLAALALTFAGVFRLYFRGAWPLPPAAASAVAVALIAALDLALIAPYFGGRRELLLSLWDWQAPAALVAATIYATGRRAAAAPARI